VLSPSEVVLSMESGFGAARKDPTWTGALKSLRVAVVVRPNSVTAAVGRSRRQCCFHLVRSERRMSER
jgi:hypothetical protein